MFKKSRTGAAACTKVCTNATHTAKSAHGVVSASAGVRSRLANLLVDGHILERSADLSSVTW